MSNFFFSIVDGTVFLPGIAFHCPSVVITGKPKKHSARLKKLL
jgi:hypothetical protein